MARIVGADFAVFHVDLSSGDPLVAAAETAEGRPKMVRMGRHKYVYDPADEVDELYDLAADPWELTNLARDPAHAAVRARLRDRLIDWSIDTEGGRPTPLYFDLTTGRNTGEGWFPDRA